LALQLPTVRLALALQLGTVKNRLALESCKEIAVGSHPWQHNQRETFSEDRELFGMGARILLGDRELFRMNERGRIQTLTQRT